MQAESIRVSIVEDDARVRDSFSRLVDQSPGFRCVSQHRSAEDALRDLPASRPHVVLMDINLPGINGVECVRALKTLLPEAQVVMLTVYEDTDLIFGALAAGASGYLLKRTPPDELLRGIRDVHRGGSPMTSHIARKVVQSFRQTDEAPRRTRSRRASARCSTTCRAATSTRKSPRDSRSATTRCTPISGAIYEKLQVHSRTEAVAKHLSRSGHPPLPGRPRPPK